MDVATRGSSYASSDSVATSGITGSAGGADVTDGVADGATTDVGMRIGGSVESDGLMHLSMMRAKYINFSMLCNWVMILSCF